MTPSQPEETSETVLKELEREWFIFAPHRGVCRVGGTGGWGGAKERGSLEYQVGREKLEG